MISCDSLVRGGRVVLPEAGAPFTADVAIQDGVVLGLLAPGADVEADNVWDASGHLVLPGAIDPHVHVSWPYLDSRTRDNYALATRAAAAGGTTTIIDFAIEGRESPLAALHARRAQAEGQAVIDFSFHVVVSDATPEVLDEIAEVVAEGVTSFKLYMTYRRRGLAVSDETLSAVAKRAAELGAVVGVHAEDADLDDAGTERMRELKQGAARFLPEAKPPHVEAEAIARAARLVSQAGGHLWILHLSSQEGLASCARRAGSVWPARGARDLPPVSAARPRLPRAPGRSALPLQPAAAHGLRPAGAVGGVGRADRRLGRHGPLSLPGRAEGQPTRRLLGLPARAARSTDTADADARTREPARYGSAVDCPGALGQHGPLVRPLPTKGNPPARQ